MTLCQCGLCAYESDDLFRFVCLEKYPRTRICLCFRMPDLASVGPLLAAVCYYGTVLGTAEISRRILDRTVSKKSSFHRFLIELIGTAQICTCVFENGKCLRLREGGVLFVRHYFNSATPTHSWAILARSTIFALDFLKLSSFSNSRNLTLLVWQSRISHAEF